MAEYSLSYIVQCSTETLIYVVIIKNGKSGDGMRLLPDLAEDRTQDLFGVNEM